MRARQPLALILTVSLGLAACGSDDDTSTGSDDGTEEAGSGESGGTEVEADTFPVEIEHRHGTTVVEEEPQRVVTIGLTDHDPVLALGVTPVGVMDWFGDHPYATWPWAQDELGDGEPEIIGGEDINFEQVAVLEPDLILAVYSGLSDDEYGQLEQIAPTVAQPEEYNDWGVPWQEQTRIVGAALGRPKLADELVQDVEDQFDEAIADHPELDGATAVVATPWQGAISVFGAEDSRGRFVERLGLEQVPELVDLVGDDFTAELSAEETELIDADVIIWILDDPAADLAELHEDELYSGLDVVAEGREVAVANESELGGATSFQTVLSLPVLIDGLVPMLADAVDGDPATEVDI